MELDDADTKPGAISLPAAPFNEPPILAEVVPSPPPVYYYVPQRRRFGLPFVLFLFVLTCVSTFTVGACRGELENLFDPIGLVVSLIEHWADGLVYMTAVMSILVAHEMGHFLQAARYRIPAELPIFIPMPLTPIGTMGAVILMQGSQADRREMFDIGISGPLAGLIVALPIAWFGIQQLEVVPAPTGTIVFADPLLFQVLTHWLRPDLPAQLPANEAFAWNPLWMAAWVGMLITGLNMLPISQLDGGHVAYSLFGRRAHWLARGMVLAAVAFIVISWQPSWIVMLVLVMLIGTDHPPTRNDRAPLGWPRFILGLHSLLIPIFCFAPVPIRYVG